MQFFPPTIVLRHRRENLNKCSLRGLESRSDFLFYTYPKDVSQLEAPGYILLTLEAQPLTVEDAHRGLFLLDATWRYAEKMFQAVSVRSSFIYRSIPAYFRTAYPRRQEDCLCPERGLASVEALFISYKILNREADDLLNNYYWKDRFLEINNKYI